MLGRLFIRLVFLPVVIMGTTHAEEVRIAMGGFEPYYIERENAGIFSDIISAAFRHLPEYKPKYIYGHSNKGLWAGFDFGHVDAASNFFGAVSGDDCLSNPAFRFHDVAISKANSHITVNNLADLKGKSIIAFQGAKKFFSEGFSRVTTGAYQEVAKPGLQVRMLLADRYQISVGDKFLFLQAIKDLGDKTVKPSDFTFHEVFPSSYTRLAFHDKLLCEKFNLALEKVKKSGQYEKIYQNYLERLGY